MIRAVYRCISNKDSPPLQPITSTVEPVHPLTYKEATSNAPLALLVRTPEDSETSAETTTLEVLSSQNTAAFLALPE